jgi:hypothetical protein
MLIKKTEILECIEKIFHISPEKFVNFSNAELTNWLFIKLKKIEKNDIHKMNTLYHNEKSVNGFDLSVLKSAMQKYIRRGEEEKALRAVEELDRFAEVEDDGSGEKIRTNMIHRLQVIFLEDIGLGNFHLWRQMAKWTDILFNADRKNPKRDRTKEIQALEQIVRHLCRSKKTRACSFMRSLSQLIDSDQKTVDEYFGYYFKTDETDPGKLLKLLDKSLAEKDWKSIIYFKKYFDLYCADEPKKRKSKRKSKSEKTEKKERKQKSDWKSTHRKTLEQMMEKYMNLDLCKKWKEDIVHLEMDGYLVYMLPIGNYLYGSEPLQVWDDTIKTTQYGWPMLGKFEIDDYVFDKHVKHAKDRSTEYFVLETSKVSNEVFRVPKEFKAIYEWSRCGKHVPNVDEVDVSDVDEADEVDEVDASDVVDVVSSVPIEQIHRETQLNFVVRIQLTTSDSKQDTYYATYNDELYFVKGPFSDRKVIDQYIHFQKLKKERGFPYLEAYCVMIIPDRWKPDEIPIGFRKSIHPDKPYPFLISKSLFSRESLKTKEHSSKKWPVTTVVDDRATEGMRVNVKELSGQMAIDYLNALGFRLEFNIGDFADRNFLKISDISSNTGKEPKRVLSVDEEIVGTKLDLKLQLRERYEPVKKLFEEYKNRLHPTSITYLSAAFV